MIGRALADYLDRVRDAVPTVLLELPVWLSWLETRAEGREKPRKVPYYIDGTPRSGTLDTPADRARLVSFDTAATAFSIAGNYTGLGVALGAVRGEVPGEDIQLSGLDLDDVATDDPRVLEILAAADSYAETSPSGRGLKIFGLGEIGTAKVTTTTGGLEIYSGRRFSPSPADA